MKNVISWNLRNGCLTGTGYFAGIERWESGGLPAGGRQVFADSGGGYQGNETGC